MLAVSSILHSQTSAPDSVRLYNLGEVIVTADRDNITKTTTSNEVSASDIRSSNASTVSSALSLVPGIHMTLSPKNESQIFLRGFTQSQIAFFMDGVPVYLPYDQLLDLNLLPASSIEKITLSKSMPSVLYGPNAMGGIVNIVTAQRMGPLQASVSAQMGTEKKASGVVSGSMSQFFWNVSSEYSTSDGFPMSKDAPVTSLQSGDRRRNSQFTKRSAFVKTGFQHTAHADVTLSFLLIDDDMGIPTSTVAVKPRYWRYTDWNKYIANLMAALDISDDLNVKGNVYYEKYGNTLDAYDDSTFTTQMKPNAFHSVYDDDTYGLDASARLIMLLPGVTKASVAYKKDRHAEIGNFNQPFKRYETNTYSIGLEQDFSLFKENQMTLGLGNDWLYPIYANDSTLRPPTSLLNGYIGLSRMLTDNLHVYGHISHKSRFPSMKEFYTLISGRNAPNPDLHPEIATNVEVGLEVVSLQKITITSALFYNDIRDLIQSVVISPGVQQYQNIGTAEFKGGEFTSSYRDGGDDLRVNYTYLSARNTTPGAASARLDYRPEHTFNATYRHFWDIGFSIATEMTAVSSFYGIDVDTRLEHELSSSVLFNLGITQEVLQHYKIFCRVNNLTDIYYQADYGFPQPGRNWIIGVNAEW
jgi:iron complex outermembrane receptor protein